MTNSPLELLAALMIVIAAFFLLVGALGLPGPLVTCHWTTTPACGRPYSAVGSSSAQQAPP